MSYLTCQDTNHTSWLRGHALRASVRPALHAPLPLQNKEPGIPHGLPIAASVSHLSAFREGSASPKIKPAQDQGEPLANRWNQT